MSKLTSVEWLISRFSHNDIIDHKKISGNKQLYNLYLRLVEQAKEMHKQEIIDTYKNAQALIMLDPTKRAEQYFYELYEKDKNKQPHTKYVIFLNADHYIWKNQTYSNEIIEEIINQLRKILM